MVNGILLQTEPLKVMWVHTVTAEEGEAKEEEGHLDLEEKRLVRSFVNIENTIKQQAPEFSGNTDSHCSQSQSASCSSFM
jgi:hypothetical protein